MFSLMSFFLVVNLAVVMRELTGCQPMSAPCASGASIRATPSVSWARSSMCPEYSSCSQDESISYPDCSHLVSLCPSTPILYFFNSLFTWMGFFSPSHNSNSYITQNFLVSLTPQMLVRFEIILLLTVEIFAICCMCE